MRNPLQGTVRKMTSPEEKAQTEKALKEHPERKQKRGERKDRDPAPAREGRLSRWMNAPEEPEEAMPLLTHLLALRRVLTVSIGAVAAGFLIVFFTVSARLVSLITAPLESQGIEVIYTEVAEVFGAQTMLSLILGCVLASPVIFGAVWWFVRPALRRKERVAAAAYLICAAFLFLLGVWFAYRFVFYLAVNFFVQKAGTMARPMFSLGRYVRFLFAFLVPFGIMFELPIVVIWLTRVGLVTAVQLRKGRRYVILVIFIVAAILTPPDVVSQVLLALPLLALFEVSILCAGIAGAGKGKNR